MRITSLDLSFPSLLAVGHSSSSCTTTYIPKGCRFRESPSRLLRTLVIIDVQHPLVQVWVVVSNHPQIASEKRVISNIETYNRGEAVPPERVSLCAMWM